MVSLVVIEVVVIRCMNLGLHHPHLPARLFSGFEWCVLWLALVGMELMMIWNMGRCTVAIANRE